MGNKITLTIAKKHQKKWKELGKEIDTNVPEYMVPALYAKKVANLLNNCGIEYSLSHDTVPSYSLFIRIPLKTFKTLFVTFQEPDNLKELLPEEDLIRVKEMHDMFSIEDGTDNYDYIILKARFGCHPQDYKKSLALLCTKIDIPYLIAYQGQPENEQPEELKRFLKQD